MLRHRYQSDETTTVVSVLRQLAKLTLKDDETLHDYFIRAQELLQRLHIAGEHLSRLFKAMVINGLTQRFEHFLVQESFQPAGSFVELILTRLNNFEQNKNQREDSDMGHVAMDTKTKLFQSNETIVIIIKTKFKA